MTKLNYGKISLLFFLRLNHDQLTLSLQKCKTALILRVTMLHVLYQLVAGLLGVESGQDAVLRALLYERRAWIVHPYGVSVAEFTNRISWLRNKLGKNGIKDEGLVENSSYPGNILAGDEYSLSYPRTPQEILRIVYGSGNESVSGGFYPHGADGHIARSYLPSV